MAQLGMTDGRESRPLRLLIGIACVVIISAGIRAAADVVSLVLFGFLLAYSALPVLQWMMRRFHVQKKIALPAAVASMAAFAILLVFLLYKNVASARERFPIYEAHARDLYQHIAAFLHAHGVDLAKFYSTKLSASSGIVSFAHLILPEMTRLFSDVPVIVLLGGIFLSMLAEHSEKADQASIFSEAENDVAEYIATSAATGILTAFADLVLLALLGVDFPLVWCVLYFFLQFIPSIGFVLAIVPPSCMALLMLGWKKAVLVATILLLCQLASNYVAKPKLLKRKGVSVSSIEKLLALLWWGFLLGPAGGIFAIPLTLALRRFIPDFSSETRVAAAASR